MQNLLPIAISLPWLAAGCVFATRRVPRVASALALATPWLVTAALLLAVIEHRDGEQLSFGWAWVPALGVHATFLADGLSLFFGLLVSGIGCLVLLYARGYLDGTVPDHPRFYAYLLLFMGAMLGTVFAGNLIWLFVFWELTGLASFLLIGYLHGDELSRRGARMALLTTGTTGLLLLAGLALLGQAAGSFEWREILRSAPARDGGLTTGAFLLIALGAFGKSAQFPFHFWLPNAMAAPTPVSAYLHSATMVKLGVFLVARVYPVFRESPWWSPLLVGAGFGTFLLAAYLALRSHLLKAILAWSTVSQLGFLIGFYGMSPPGGAHWDLLHILNHAIYKGGLFMVAGIVTHATGLTDIREMGGLRKRLPSLAAVCVVLAAAMAGAPGTLGFVSKEYMLKEKFDYVFAGDFLNYFPIVAVAIGSVLKVAFSVRFAAGIFFGPERPGATAHYHAPSRLILLPPAVLAGLTLSLGCWPAGLMPFFRAFAVPGLHATIADGYVLKVWHGLTPALVLSVGIVAAGILLYRFGGTICWRWPRIPRWLDHERHFDRAMDALPAGASTVTRWLRADTPLDYLPIVAGTIACAVLGALVHVVPVQGWWGLWAGLGADPAPLHLSLCALAALSAFGVVFSARWVTQLILLSVNGFTVTMIYIFYRAPDLALTQLLVESATLILAVLLLRRFPRQAQQGERHGWGRGFRGAVNLTVSVAVGVAVTLFLAAVVSRPPGGRDGEWFLAHSLDAAKGSNAVNTILIDFRGFDTLLEISVLVAAALGCLGLVNRYRRTASERAAGEKGLAGLMEAGKEGPR